MECAVIVEERHMALADATKLTRMIDGRTLEVVIRPSKFSLFNLLEQPDVIDIKYSRYIFHIYKKLSHFSIIWNINLSNKALLNLSTLGLR